MDTKADRVLRRAKVAEIAQAKKPEAQVEAPVVEVASQELEADTKK